MEGEKSYPYLQQIMSIAAVNLYFEHCKGYYKRAPHIPSHVRRIEKFEIGLTNTVQIV